MPSSPVLRDIFIDTALRAGALIEHIKSIGTHARRKSNGSDVTDADTAAETLIADMLRAAYPDIIFIGEESLSPETAPVTPDTDMFFCVDPLDGTKDFISGSSDYTVNIALVQCGYPIAGVIYAPATHCLYIAIDGIAQSYITSAKHTIISAPHIIRCSAPTQTPRVVSSRFHMTGKTAEFIKKHRVSTVRQIGSSIKFCMVAEGSADIYPRYAGSMEWDTAAGQAILEAAGGSVKTFDGARLSYGKHVAADGKSAYFNPPFIANSH